jgi:hypothetical protein
LRSYGAVRHDRYEISWLLTVRRTEECCDSVDGIISNYPDVLRAVIAEQARPAAA